jgi:hypothetical protein
MIAPDSRSCASQAKTSQTRRMASALPDATPEQPDLGAPQGRVRSPEGRGSKLPSAFLLPRRSPLGRRGGSRAPTQLQPGDGRQARSQGRNGGRHCPWRHRRWPRLGQPPHAHRGDAPMTNQTALQTAPQTTGKQGGLAAPDGPKPPFTWAMALRYLPDAPTRSGVVSRFRAAGFSADKFESSRKTRLALADALTREEDRLEFQRGKGAAEQRDMIRQLRRALECEGDR